MRNLIQNFSLLLFMISPLWAVAGEKTERARLDYIKKHKSYALMVELRYGVPASICMAQALLETDAGRSNLNLLGNNHFGIKAGVQWKGPTMKKIDDKIDSLGNPILSNFRIYKNAAESFKNYGLMLSTSDRYRPLFHIDKADFRAWAHGLHNKGYASNPQYANLLIHLIIRYKLDELSLMQVRTFPDYHLIADESVSSEHYFFHWDMPFEYKQPTYAMLEHSGLFRMMVLFLLFRFLYLPLQDFFTIPYGLK